MSRARTSRSSIRWAEGQIDRLPALAADLVRRQVAVIAATGRWGFGVRGQGGNHDDPHRLPHRRRPGQAWSRRQPCRPGGNLTGINFLVIELTAKRLELLRELVPTAARLAVLVNPANVATTETTVQAVKTAARAMGLQIQVLNAGTSREIDAAFAAFARERPDALFVGTGPSVHRQARPTGPTWRRAIGSPRSIRCRQFAEVGGLMSYGANLTDAYRQVGVYVGRILKGAKPRTCRSCSRPSSSWSSTSRPPRRSASTCRRRCSPAPTR